MLPGPQEKHPAFLMKMAVDRAEAIFTQYVGDLRLTAPQCRLLMYLESRGGEPVSQRELEHYLGVSHTSVKGLLARLEQKGYVRTAFDCEDGRVKHAYLTEVFRRMQEEAQQAFLAFEEHLLTGISPAERAELSRLLQIVYSNTLTTEPAVPFSKHQ
ncbi:MAG: winged helix-turn-helix transcriptional regulator [Akkermansia sp.]|nr:winged helix-turn-helix transcriptional regulator [Akkermansia sp.]